DLLGAYDAGWEIYQMAKDLAETRLADPADDVTSVLVHAELDGERLSSHEVATFFTLLVVAGNETTRNAISHGLLALTQYPEQRRIWMKSFEEITPTAVDEIVRWGSPVIHMRRRVTRDTIFQGVPMAKDD